MDYFNKYKKYKQKYLDVKPNFSNKINCQKAGSAALEARGFTEQYMDQLSLKDQKYIIDESFRLNRYFHQYYNVDNILTAEGTHVAYGPVGQQEKFNIKNYVEIVEVDVDMYESWLIYEYLVRINKNLDRFGIKTVQSQISYYSKDIEFSSPNHFQTPFLSFEGNTESISILTQMMLHPLARDLLFFSHYDTRYDPSFELSHNTYITFAKRIFNTGGKFIFTFDDTDFWTTMETISEDMKLQEVSVFTGNDPDLDYSKDWYVINDDAEVVRIEDKTKAHPFSLNNLPLTKLNVRYVDNITEFTIVYH